MANHRGVKLCKARGQYTENRMANVWMSRTLFTDLYNLALSGSSQLLSRYPLLLVWLRLCSTVQLGLSLWPRELDKPPWSREDGAGFSIPSSESLLVERVERLNSFKSRSEGLQMDLSLTIFLCYPSVLRKDTSLGEIFLRVVYNWFEHRVTRWKVSDRRHIVYLICVSNTRVSTKSVKFDQSEGIPDPGIRERPFVKFSHRCSLASSRCAFFIFSRAVFCVAPWLTERLEEATKTIKENIWLICPLLSVFKGGKFLKNLWCCIVREYYKIIWFYQLHW